MTKRAFSFFLALLFLLPALAGCTIASKPADTTDPNGQETDPFPSDTTVDPDTAPPETTPPVTENPGSMKKTYIHSISELNTSGTLDDHAEEYATSRLESNFREYFSLDPSFLGSTLNYYPRLKKMADGRYILFYQNGNHGPDVLYCFSEDGIHFTKPQKLFVHTESRLYATCDAAVLQNGDLVAVCSFRYATQYVRYPAQCGLAVRRSTDNGKTWTAEKIIFRGCTWEPSLLQLSSGELQVYWTNTTGLDTPEGNFTSTGTAILRSDDNGETWSANIRDTYNGQIVSQSKTENISGVQMFSEQMPVAVELHNGKIALALEVRLNRKPEFRLSISYSADNWAQALTPFVEEGPADKLNRFCIGAGPYLAQFPSGETVLTYNRKNHLTYVIGSPDANDFGAEDAPYTGLSTSYWAGSTIVGSHCLATVNEYIVDNGVQKTTNLVGGRLYLNHRIDARALTVTADGDASEWAEHDEALFCGSVSQAQAAVRCAVSGEDLAFLVERLDYDLNASGDTVSLMICPEKGKYYQLVLGCEGISSFSVTENGKRTALDTAGIRFGCLVNEAETEEDPQAGYAAELLIPRSLLGNPSGSFLMNILLSNVDAGQKSDRDTLTGTTLSNPDTWYPVRLP